MDPAFSQMFETLERIEKSLAERNLVPSTAVPSEGPNDAVGQAVRKYLTSEEQFSLRQELRTKSTDELHFMFRQQAAKRDIGIPLDVWASSGGRAVSEALSGSDNSLLTKALDTTGATPLIRQDLEPIIYALFVKMFPAWDRFRKEPANGLVHAFNQVTSYGDAQFMTELGTVTDDQSTYVRQTSNISVIGTRRGISLKSQFGVQAGGMAWNPEQLELENGLRAVAHKMQKTIFQGNASAASGTSSTEDGAYDANAFNGLRGILKASTYNADILAATPDDIRKVIDQAAVPVMDAGGAVNVVYLRATEKTAFDLQQDKNVRYMDTHVEVTPGILTNAVNTVFGPLPLVVVPGDSIGTYSPGSAFSAATTCADAYLLDEQTLSMPYLGSEGPTVLEIPTGISGQLTKLFIVFGMWGLAVKALPFQQKVRIRVS